MTRNWASNIRKIQKTGGVSRYITIPANLLRDLGWKERQKVVAKKIRGPADGYYKVDVYLYYILVFLLPLVAGYFKTKNKKN